ncbi:MAG: hypothetical protein QOJ13_2920 [Gaiellales bacterium]|jgi:hypothetical protein|nr:hypothetical protein [Gaiellales bacterium]
MGAASALIAVVGSAVLVGAVVPQPDRQPRAAAGPSHRVFAVNSLGDDLDLLGVRLLRAKDLSPPVNRREAVAVARRLLGRRPVLGVTLARCDQFVIAERPRDCYVVRLDPGRVRVLMSGPLGRSDSLPDSTPRTSLGVLVDSHTGKAIFGWITGSTVPQQVSATWLSHRQWS